MDSNLFTLVKFRSDIETLLQEIDILSDSLYRIGDRDFAHTVSNSVRRETAEYLQSANLNIEDRKQQLDALKKQLQNVIIVKITLAFEPNAAIAENISAALRKIFDASSVIDFAFDKSIVAGAVIEYQGKYFDGSLGKKLAEIDINL